MKRFAKVFAAIGVLLSIPLSGQITIGQYTLARMAAPALEASIGAGGFTAGFLGRVGGVAFKETAHPAPGLSAQSIELQYAPQYPDGQRVVAVIDGQRVPLNLYDWQLKPVVQFANSSDHAVFTLFGELADKGKESEVLDNGGRVVNYHAAFDNTLLGLRMLQLDNLLAGSQGDDLAVDLPQEHGRYLLGPGEPSPDIARNRAALVRYNAAVVAGLREAAASFRSYVVGDAGRDVQFDVRGGALHITGQPGYYFWRYNGDDPAVQERLQSSVRAQIGLAKNAARQAQGAAFNERSWLVAQVVALAKSEGEPLPAEAVRILQSEDAGELNSDLEDLRVEQKMGQPAYRKVEPLTELNQFVNARLNLVRSINPIVWDAATTVMRDSAFFRYCKEHSPAAWQDFVSQVGSIKVQPSVTTPTVLRLATANRSPFDR